MFDLLKGVRVVELTTIVLGPMAGQILADFGADVVKIEAPDGDLARHVEPRSEAGESSMFVNCNRNKQSIAIDLKTQEGREVLKRLISQADVFLHNMRMKAVRKLGFDAATLRAINPGLVYCSAIGFGSDGPYADRPAYDDVIQAASGIAHLPTYTGAEPAYVPGVIADKVAALYAANAISSALYNKAQTGQGVEIEVPMFEVMTSFVMTEHLAAASFEQDAKPGYRRLLNRHRRPFKSSDGWVAVLPYTEAHWRSTLEEIGRADVIDQEWFESASTRSNHVAEMYEILAQVMPKRSTDDWINTFERLDVPHSRVSSLGDLLNDPHLQAVDFFGVTDDTTGRARSVPQPVKVNGAHTTVDRGAPLLSENSISLLQELGYEPTKVHDMIERGVVQAPPPKEGE
ncbi:CoA transferase [Sulfitobacter sp. W027]|uniref:CaiB/BaiF CoA transferase family protein n=1 Tax=Sulfitobacter sp. W027 TaxID=2867025 RepID=UPI0021A7E723|nr:CoA transferase [Sulfitobacter sp. W027]UWR33009.1 CoA transferase [Sulfitobacter sp. W027]